jgi:hypothetical protein
LEEDKLALEKEKARIPNQHDFDEKLKTLRKECDELRRQIGQKQSEITDQTILLADKRKKFGVTAKQYEELTHTVDTLEVQNLFSFLFLILRIFLFIFKVGISSSNTSTSRITQTNR